CPRRQSVLGAERGRGGRSRQRGGAEGHGGAGCHLAGVFAPAQEKVQEHGGDGQIGHYADGQEGGAEAIRWGRTVDGPVSHGTTPVGGRKRWLSREVWLALGTRGG